MKEFKDLKIAVAGTGYVGLSLAVLLAQHHQVTALDIVPEKVEMINNKKSPIRDEYIEKYLAEKMPQILYQKNYEQIAVIDLKRRKIAINSAEVFDFSQSLERELDYEQYLKEVMECFVPEEEKAQFKNYTELNNIKKELDLKGRYSF